MVNPRRKRGRPRKKAGELKDALISVQVEPSVRKQFYWLAALRNVPAAHVVREAMRDYIAALPQETRQKIGLPVVKSAAA